MRQLRECMDALKKEGLTVYAPAMHEGVCTSPYCVVQYLGGYPHSGKTGYEILRVHIYAPVGKFALIEDMKHRVEKALSPLAETRALRPCDGVGACLVDDTYKAHACYLDYRVQYGLNK